MHFWNQTSWVEIPALSVTRCVLGSYLSSFDLILHQLKKANYKKVHMTVLRLVNVSKIIETEPDIRCMMNSSHFCFLHLGHSSSHLDNF